MHDSNKIVHEKGDNYEGILAQLKMYELIDPTITVTDNSLSLWFSPMESNSKTIFFEDLAKPLTTPFPTSFFFFFFLVRKCRFQQVNRVEKYFHMLQLTIGFLPWLNLNLLLKKILCYDMIKLMHNDYKIINFCWSLSYSTDRIKYHNIFTIS